MPRRRATLSTETIDVEGLTVAVVRKKVKNLNLRVLPDGSVRVSVGPTVGLDQVTRFVSQKRAWIDRARSRLADKRAIDVRSFVEGATINLWGRPLTCHIEEVPGSGSAYRATFAMKGGRLIARCGERCAADDSVAQGLRDQMFERWLDDTFRDAVERELHPLEELVGKRSSKIRLRRMKTRWGSCNVKTAAVTLNTQLVHYPIECLRYVIIHELCHLYEPNHGPRFHQLMDGFCPNWKDLRATLNLR